MKKEWRSILRTGCGFSRVQQLMREHSNWRGCLRREFIPFAVVAGEKATEENELADLAYTYMATGLVKGILPGEDGGRIVQPHVFVALFLYEAVKMAYDEMVNEED